MLKSIILIITTLFISFSAVANTLTPEQLMGTYTYQGNEEDLKEAFIKYGEIKYNERGQMEVSLGYDADYMGYTAGLTLDDGDWYFSEYIEDVCDDYDCSSVTYISGAMTLKNNKLIIDVGYTVYHGYSYGEEGYEGEKEYSVELTFEAPLAQPTPLYLVQDETEEIQRLRKICLENAHKLNTKLSCITSQRYLFSQAITPPVMKQFKENELIWYGKIIPLTREQLKSTWLGKLELSLSYLKLLKQGEDDLAAIAALTDYKSQLAEHLSKDTEAELLLFLNHSSRPEVEKSKVIMIKGKEITLFSI